VQGKRLGAAITERINDLENLGMTDRKIKERIYGLMQKLFDRQTPILVEKGEVSFDPAFMVFPDEISNLCKLITHENSPITRLKLASDIITGDADYDDLSTALGNPNNRVESLNFKMDRDDKNFNVSAHYLIIDSLSGLHNKIKKIDLSQNNLSDLSVMLIAEHLADAHNKLEEIDFRDNIDDFGKKISHSAEDYFIKQAALTGRNIKITF